jgi:hypothetical protein
VGVFDEVGVLVGIKGTLKMGGRYINWVGYGVGDSVEVIVSVSVKAGVKVNVGEGVKVLVSGTVKGVCSVGSGVFGMIISLRLKS